MNAYKQTFHPVFGAVAVALTAMTIGLGVVLPAKIDGGAREVRTAAIPAQPAVAPAVLDFGRVVVIAKRDPAWMPLHALLAAPKAKAQASGPLGVRAVAARERLGRTDADLQRALCPYLTSGTVAATS